MVYIYVTYIYIVICYIPYIVDAVSKLKNNKSVGPDDIAGELYKYGGDELVNLIQDLINKMFTEHGEVKEMGEGYLFPLSKPDKQRTAENTRGM